MSWRGNGNGMEFEWNMDCPCIQGNEHLKRCRWRRRRGMRCNVAPQAVIMLARTLARGSGAGIRCHSGGVPVGLCHQLLRTSREQRQQHKRNTPYADSDCPAMQCASAHSDQYIALDLSRDFPYPAPECAAGHVAPA